MSSEHYPGIPEEIGPQPDHGREPYADQMFPYPGELPIGVSHERFGDRAEEIGYLVQLANFIDELVNDPVHGRQQGVDSATDLLGWYGRQVAINDPAHARNVIEALEWHGNRQAAFYVARDIRVQLGLPPLDLDDRGFAG
ncbi:hypothetical protein WIS52_14955 [Pseudonocardia nematodicida]|uniref:Uncharacterized protein n=1 Tax=Pseudonocardia nematodicida TaxID=1206997 RepID=A0ABV1KBC0_9PSEU